MKQANPFEEIAKEYPIICTKPFFNFGYSLYKLKEKLNRKKKHEKNIR